MQTRVRGWKVDILGTTIYHILFGPEFLAPRSIAKFDHKVGLTRDLNLMRDVDHQTDLMRWVANLITE